MIERLRKFVIESNLIEGINRDPTADEIDAHSRVLRLFSISATTLGDFQAVVAPGKPLREKPGMNVRVGNYIAPEGGPNIVKRLQKICHDANMAAACPWKLHCRFERLHPYIDGNGRTGRALWMWIMHSARRDPFGLTFLHRFYYQTLENSRL